MFKRTKIVATLGPASSSHQSIQSLVEAGVDVFRINFSHGTPEQRQDLLTNVRGVEADLRRPLAICADLCGPKIRVGMMAEGGVALEPGQELVVQRTPLTGTARRVSTTFGEIVDVASVGEQILLADGRIRLQVIRSSPPEEFVCRVIVGGKLTSGKGVNLPDTEIPLSALTEKDQRDVDWIVQRDFDYVALSFVQRAADICELRGLLDAASCDARIIAKIEKPQALNHIDEIIEQADAVMVARGDLAVEMDFPAVPIAQKTITGKCEAAGKPCIIATEMLESMIQSSTPTRAEVSDIANAVFDHADAVMLSAESSIGAHPARAVGIMRDTVVAAQEYLETHGRRRQVTPGQPATAAAVARSIREIMKTQEIAAVVLLTETGLTARLTAKNRPACPVIALSSRPQTVRRCGLYYGVQSQQVRHLDNATDLLNVASQVSVQLGHAQTGDHIIIIAGYPIGAPGGTDGLVIHQIEST